MGLSQSHPPGLTLDSLCQELAAGKYKNVVVMCGAGISTNAGVPDFRSPSAGIYFKLRKYNLPYPEAVFEGGYFRQNPLPFYGLVRDIFPERLEPTTTHKFFSLLNSKGILRRVYTQNIDALEIYGGVPRDKVVEAHGTFHSSHCVSCKRVFDLIWLKKEIFAPETNGGVPKCPSCHGVVRPDVVFFGEALPDTFWSQSSRDLPQCDLLLIFGTSLAVAPFNQLVSRTGRNVPRVFVNKTRPGSVGLLAWFMGLGRSVSLNGPGDLVVLGDCDETVKKMCDKSGWTQELNDVQVQILEA